MRTVLAAFSVVLVVGLLAACAETTSDDDDADDTAAAAGVTETPTPEPPEPSPTPEADPTPDPTPVPEETPTPDADDAEEPEPTEHIVEIGDNFFDPETLQIEPGDTVTFVNIGGMNHTATLDPDPDVVRDPDNVIMPDDAEIWNSGTLEPGDEFSITLDVPGEYQYVCLPHEALDMFGQIIVGDDVELEAAPDNDDENDGDDDSNDVDYY